MISLLSVRSHFSNVCSTRLLLLRRFFLMECLSLNPISHSLYSPSCETLLFSRAHFVLRLQVPRPPVLHARLFVLPGPACALHNRTFSHFATYLLSPDMVIRLTD